MELVSVKHDDMDALFLLYKSALKHEIEPVYGWDEEFQRQRFSDSYKLEWLYWITSNNQRIGYCCFKTIDTNLHLHLLVISDEYRNQGYGSKLMSKLNEVAQSQDTSTITLSTFKTNAGAIKLYERLGFNKTNEEEHFYDFQRLVS